ncbi:hypothetical protein ASE36_21315 [Rhizobium sp. Root274]|nr:hypothetical protein ASC71_21375 [Rhizobium sp. Root1240]KRD26095.1 hypothetical protein ASE36_21315 [Rhizobium sp. Root274]
MQRAMSAGAGRTVLGDQCFFRKDGAEFEGIDLVALSEAVASGERQRVAIARACISGRRC